MNVAVVVSPRCSVYIVVCVVVYNGVAVAGPLSAPVEPNIETAMAATDACSSEFAASQSKARADYDR